MSLSVRKTLDGRGKGLYLINGTLKKNNIVIRMSKPKIIQKKD